MKYRSLVRVSSAMVLGVCLVLTGEARPPAAVPEPGLVPTPVSLPVEREVTDYTAFTARIAAVDSVEVKAHVWGYLQKVNFKEGDLVGRTSSSRSTRGRTRRP